MVLLIFVVGLPLAEFVLVLGNEDEIKGLEMRATGADDKIKIPLTHTCGRERESEWAEG